MVLSFQEDDVANVADVVDVAAKERVHVESPVSVLSDEVLDLHRS